MDLSKLNLPKDVRPLWDKEGLPWCSRSESCVLWNAMVGSGCCSLDGAATAHCQQALRPMIRAIPGFLEGA